MTLHPRDWFRGAGIVATRDLASNLKSVRVIVVTVLTLLVMLGAAFGLSGLAPTGPGARYEHVAWVHSADVDDNGTYDGLVVWVSDGFGVPQAGVDMALGEPDQGDVFVERETRITNASGWVAFRDLGPGWYPLEMRIGDLALTSFGLVTWTPYPVGLSTSFRQFDLVGDGAMRDARLQVVVPSGQPAAEAEILLNGTAQGRPDANGYWGARLDPGDYRINVTYGGEDVGLTFYVTEPTVLLPFLSGPDSVLAFLAFGLMGLFAPIVAIAVSYDALAKERLQGSLELLLVRPASREGLAIGKFLGTFLSVALPMFAVLLASLAGIAALTGRAPDAGFAGAFVLATLALLATYILIMQIFSTFVKSPGTAILSAILVWLVFNVIWSLVVLLVTAALGIETATPEYFAISAATSLLNPSGVYSLTLLAFLPPSVTFLGGGTGSLPDWSGPLAFAVWIAALLVLAVVLFRKKIV